MNPNTRKILVWIGVLVAFLVLVGSIVVIVIKKGAPFFLGAKKTCEGCSVIVVSLDTLSANDLPCYGYTRNTSPNLCQFAKKHTLFKNAYTNATYTLPSHASIFTGLYPFQHGVNVVGDKLDASHSFFPEELKKVGYRTMAVLPKNHSHLPKAGLYDRGIDMYFDEDKTRSWNEPLEDFREGVENGEKMFLFLHTYYVHAPYLIDDQPLLYPVQQVPEIPTTHNAVDTFTEDVRHWMREHYDYILQPLESTRDDMLKLENFKELVKKEDVSLQELQEKSDALKKYNKNIFGYLFTVPNFYQKIQNDNVEHRDFLRSLYDQKIHELDSTFLKELIDFYDQNRRIRNKVIIVITADHGEEFMEHGEMFHKTLYDSNTKVPLIMVYPSGGSDQIVKLAQSVDIVPTLRALLGMKSLVGVPGIDLLSDNTPAQNRLLVADNVDLTLKTIRWGQWKLFVRQEDRAYTPFELYNYESDPKEKNNVLFSNMKIAKDMLRMYTDQFGLPKENINDEENDASVANGEQ